MNGRRPVYRIGLTGGIGSGKSEVARVLRGLGARVVVADEIARELVAPGSPVLERLVEAFEECAQGLWDGGLEIDGGDFEQIMLKHGLWVEVPATPEVAGEWGTDVMHTWIWSGASSPSYL